MGPSFKTVKDQFTAANINAMGISCADIGGFSSMMKCTDGEIKDTSAMCSADPTKCADTNKCAALPTDGVQCKMTDLSSASSALTWSSWLVFSALTFVITPRTYSLA